MESTPAPRVDKQRVTDRIFGDLKEQIVSGARRRGSKLPTERELAAQYSVSVPSVREAIRGLTVSGLVDVRHGSGAYVSANDDSLVAIALGSVIRLQDARARDALDLLNLFIEHAAAAAVARATPTDLRRLRDAAEACADRSNIQRSATAARAFHHALINAAHNPLLLALSTYLAEVQTEFMREVAQRSPGRWRKATENIQAIRMRFVEAIEARRAKLAVAAARAFGLEAATALALLEVGEDGDSGSPVLDGLMADVLSRIERSHDAA